MNDKKSEIIYNAVTNISDKHIEEALSTALVQKYTALKIVRRFAAVAAAFALVLIGVFAAFDKDEYGTVDTTADREKNEAFTDDNASSDCFDGLMEDTCEDADSSQKYAFMSYSGPVLPLTLMEENMNITAARDITFDFTPWSTKNSENIIVKDNYTLTNVSDNDEKITVLYPLISSVREFSNTIPKLTLNGVELAAEIKAGACINAHSWDEYKQLLSDNEYLENALTQSADFSDISVTVYEFSSSSLQLADSNMDIHAVFDLDFEKTNILAYGFKNAGKYDDHIDSAFALSELKNGTPAFLIVTGEDIKNLHTEIYRDNEIKEYSVGIKRYETELANAMRMVLPYLYEDYDYGEAVDFELYYEIFCNYLLTENVLADDMEEYYFLTDISAATADCVIYLKSEITVLAGKTVTIAAELNKTPSFDYGGTGTDHEGVYGYDIAVQLGSNLKYTEQTARLIDYSAFEIVDQNCNFDMESGVDTVKLDLSNDYYYIEVK